ncbi:MAG: hypothetical protein JSR37_06720 [Verrucomicrobia bacterium]|nr:hypothetical protein [Verrucomicrobiota bacterium]MBS0636797.1 hypothetical protein [Verrucomicrobiota bacterium]
MTSQLSTASVSFDPSKPTNVLPENFGKCLPLKSHTPTTALAFGVEVDDVKAQLAAQQVRIQAVLNTLQWHMPASCVLSTEVASIKSRLESIKSVLHGEGELDTAGLDLSLAAVQETTEIPQLFRRVHEQAMRSFLAQESMPTLLALTETSEFQLLYQDFKMILRDFYADLDTFVSAADLVMHKYIHHCVDQQLAIRFSQVANGNIRDANALMTAIEEAPVKHFDRVEDRYKDGMKRELFMLMLRLCLQRTDFHKQDDKVRMWRRSMLGVLVEEQKSLRELEAADTVTHIVLDQYRPEEPHSYGFVKYIGWFERSQSRAFGEELEQDVGLRLEGLIQFLKNRLVQVAQGTCSKFEHKQLKDCITTLENKFQTHFKKIANAEYDDFRPALFDYMYGLVWGLKEARGLYQLGLSCDDASKAAVTKAIRTFSAFHEGEEQTVLGLLPSLDARHEAKALDRPLNSLDAFFSRQLLSITELHAHKDPSYVAMSTLEKSVSGLVFARKCPFVGDLLAPYVVSWVTKRIMQFLFLKAPVHDMELELVLYELKNRYSDAYDESGLQPIVERYEKRYKRTEVVSEACSTIAYLNSLAQSGDLDAYVEAWQRLFEYKVSMSRFEGANEMVDMLIERQNRLTFPQIDKEVATAHIAAWPIRNPDEFFSELQKISIHRQYGFTSVCMKVLCGCLYAVDPIQKSNAQKALSVLLQKEEYRPYLAPLKELIMLNAALRITNLLDIELEFVSAPDGLIERFLQTKQGPVQFLLYTLIEGGNFELRERTQHALGEFEYSRWMKTMAAVATKNPLETKDIPCK